MANPAIKTPVATISYPNLFTPQKDDQGKEKYGCALVFPPGADLSALKAAAAEVVSAKWGDAGLRDLQAGKLRNPFRTDVAKKGYPDGSVFMNVRTDRQPGVVANERDPETGKLRKIVDPAEVYAGAQVLATIIPFAYDKNGRGVSFALNNVCKVADGERIDGRVAAEDEFDEEMSEAPPSLADLFATS